MNSKPFICVKKFQKNGGKCQKLSRFDQMNQFNFWFHRCSFLINKYFFKDDENQTTKEWIGSIVDKLVDISIDRSNTKLILEQVRLKSKYLFDTWKELQVFLSN